MKTTLFDDNKIKSDFTLISYTTPDEKTDLSRTGDERRNRYLSSKVTKCSTESESNREEHNKMR